MNDTQSAAGDSCLFLISYLHPYKFIAKIYTNRDKCYWLSGIINTNRYVRRFTRKDKIFIIMKYDYLEDKYLKCNKRKVGGDTEGYDVHDFKDIEEN